ncbi:MAG: TetR/AcrR family transcriptional regulator [Armatimonadetes bacterium]|nr:TetR/AcrR family transcriptional regulator [Armatimonadota bacterium]
MGRTSDAKERILDSALALIQERGYANVGVEDIMQTAKVGKSSFYHFFKSKEKLGEAVVDEYTRRTCKDLFDRAFAADIHPLQRFHKLTAMLQTDTRPIVGCLGGNGAAEHANNSEPLRIKTDAFLDQIVGRFEDTFAEAVSEMDLHPDAPTHDLAAASVAYLQGLFLLCKVKQSWEPMTTLGPMVEHLWHPYLV